VSSYLDIPNNLLVTTAYEIQKLNLLLGLDEPGFLLQSIKGASLIKDSSLNNKVCS
jgi:hypothetical protein